jgi:hypothetical protein
MNLSQIKLEFRADEDRLLLTVSTSDAKEVLVWLTRRCVRLLWPALMQAASAATGIVQQGQPGAREAVLGMRHEAAVAKSDFSQPYAQAARERPLGEEPMLAARLQTRALPDGRFVLGLLPQDGTGIHLNLDEMLLHSFCKLLQATVDKAQWDMKLELPAGTQAPRSLN